MGILDVIFYGPLPIVYVFLLLLFLSTPKLRSKWWAKAGLTVGVVLLVFGIISFTAATNAKRADGIRLAETRSIKKVTQQASVLISEGKPKQAKEMLDRFNKEYSALMSYEESTSLINDISGVK